jgi:hypothetical protein
VDRATGDPLADIEVLSVRGRSLSPADTAIVPGPGLTDAIRASIPALRAAR